MKTHPYFIKSTAPLPASCFPLCVLGNLKQNSTSFSCRVKMHHHYCASCVMVKSNRILCNARWNRRSLGKFIPAHCKKCPPHISYSFFLFLLGKIPCDLISHSKPALWWILLSLVLCISWQMRKRQFEKDLHRSKNLLSQYFRGYIRCLELLFTPAAQGFIILNVNVIWIL